ncbi:hypothetical protein [[Clostridium] colinum]|uniref:hypothetical protein n=1 Tax=[Clostridium] colinum TaxID=36835 RepID=UPI002024B7F7|nr:hypothetical protein [[Clostridium] colinum]
MKNKKNIIIISSFIIIITCVFLLYFLNKLSKNSNDMPINNKTLKSLNEFNEKLDEYYITTWDQNKFLSSYSYLVKNNYSEVTLEDIEQSLNYSIPEEIKNVSIHFVKPKSLKPYLGDKILDEDPEILTVYSALPVENGMYISSKFDKGGVISEKDYKEFVTQHSWMHGDIKTPQKEDKDYIEIMNAVVEKDELLKDGNIKHIACDDKYAIVVVSNKDNPAYIKQYALEKNNEGKYKIIVEDLETLDSKIFINYAYTDFELGLLPLYEISSYNNISSNQDYIISTLKNEGKIDNNEEVTYSCGAGNFIYLEFKSNLKILLYKNKEGNLDIYEVDNFKTALSKMLSLESNPPAFILNFQ